MKTIGKDVKFRETLVMKPSDKPKLRSALMTTINNAEEAKAITRELFLRELIKSTQEYCEANDLDPPKDKLGMHSVKKVPREVLEKLGAEQMRQYVGMLKELALTQVAAIKVLDPFDTGKSVTAIKQQARKPAKSFEELMAKELGELVLDPEKNNN